jgi:hypothetical protein
LILLDIADNSIGYLPLTLEAGETSPVIVLKAIPEALGERLRSSNTPEVILWGRIQGVGAFQDLNAEPLNLDAYLHGYALVEIKAEASAGIAGVVRVGQFLGGASGGGAGWLD